jgi:hypothetical protein
MSRPSTRLRVPALLLAALTGLLVFAATASAETRSGEATIIELGPSPSLEGTMVKASASYDTTGGTLSLSVTTAGEPNLLSDDGLEAFFLTPTSENPLTGATEAQACNRFVAEEEHDFPYSTIESAYGQSDADAYLFVGPALPVTFAATKTVTGATTDFSTTSVKFANQPFDCVYVNIAEPLGLGSVTAFPITVPVAPPPPVGPQTPPATPAPSPAAATAPAPAVLSIARPKALKLKVGKSKTVKVKVTDTGGTATAKGSLKVQGPKGVIVKPGKQQIPALLPGGILSLSIRVELTEKAKEKSTLSLTGTASGLTAMSSFVIRLIE